MYEKVYPVTIVKTEREMETENGFGYLPLLVYKPLNFHEKIRLANVRFNGAGGSANTKRNPPSSCSISGLSLIFETFVIRRVVDWLAGSILGLVNPKTPR